MGSQRAEFYVVRTSGFIKIYFIIRDWGMKSENKIENKKWLKVEELKIWKFYYSQFRNFIFPPYFRLPHTYHLVDSNLLSLFILCSSLYQFSVNFHRLSPNFSSSLSFLCVFHKRNHLIEKCPSYFTHNFLLLRLTSIIAPFINSKPCLVHH